jgi:hypothetical protein
MKFALFVHTFTGEAVLISADREQFVDSWKMKKSYEFKGEVKLVRYTDDGMAIEEKTEETS